MKILLEVDIAHVAGKNLSAAEVAEALGANLLFPGEDREGRVWVDGSEYQIHEVRQVDARHRR